jgi:hypothetical protein
MSITENKVSVSWRGGLPELVTELERQKKAKIDFVADSRTIKVVPGTPLAPGSYPTGFPSGSLYLSPATSQVGEFLMEPHRLSDRAIEQLGERVKPNVPGRFARDLAACQPRIAANLLNSMLNETPSRVMFRCLDGRVRAALSNKYRILDDLDIAFASLGVIKNNNGTILECTASESRMEIKFTATHMVEHIPELRGGTGYSKHVGRTTLDPGKFAHLGVGAVCPFVRVSHSSVGEGGLNVGFGLLRLACINGAISEQAMNQIHLGGAAEVGLLSEETIAADSKAIMLKCRDLIQSSLSPVVFNRIVQSGKRAQADTIDAPTAAVANLVENTNLSDTDREGILTHFLRDYDSNRWGLAQAISRYSQECDDAATASEMETIAGKVIASRQLITI